MKITKRQLKRIIREEKARLNEGQSPDELIIEDIVDILVKHGAIRTRGQRAQYDGGGGGRMAYGWAADYLRTIIPKLEQM